MALPEFKPYAKIPRLGNAGCMITEKIDGTNGIIYIPHDTSEPLIAGSRNRWLVNFRSGNKADDNYGFAAWVAQNEVLLRRLGPGYHYGEWWGQGIGRNYGLSERRFSLFQAGRWTGRVPEGTADIVGVVPILHQGRMDGFSAELDSIVSRLFTEGSRAVPGWMKPEGVVIEVANHLYKITDNGDVSKWKLAKESCAINLRLPPVDLRPFETVSELAAS